MLDLRRELDALAERGPARGADAVFAGATGRHHRRGRRALLLALAAGVLVVVLIGVVAVTRGSDSRHTATVNRPPTASSGALAQDGMDAVLSYVDGNDLVSVDPVSGNTARFGLPFGCQACPSVRVGKTAYASDGTNVYALDADTLTPRVFAAGRAVFPSADGASLFVVTSANTIDGRANTIEERSPQGALVAGPYTLPPGYGFPEVPRAVVDGVLVELDVNGPSASAIWNPVTGALRPIASAWQVIDTFTASGATSSTIAWLSRECGNGSTVYGCSLNFTNSSTLVSLAVGVPAGYTQYFGGGAFSPDGRSLAVFVSNTGSSNPHADLAILTTRPEVSETGIAADTPQIISGSSIAVGEPRGFAAWTPDGKWVVFGGNNGSLLASRAGATDAVALDVPAFYSLAVLPFPTGYRRLPSTEPNGVDPITWVGEAAGRTTVIDLPSPPGDYVSVVRNGDAICIGVDHAGRDDGPVDCSTLAYGPWPNGQMSAAIVQFDGNLLVVVAQDAITSVDVTVADVTVGTNVGQTMAFPGLRFFAVPLNGVPAHVVGHSSSGDVSLDVG